ncbi:MAG: type IVB secretion system protein IcmH/DotU [Granulosicoccus sp.]
MSDDPFDFEEDDKTVLRPGNRLSAAGSRPTSPRSASALQPSDIPLLGGINPLEQAASKLLPLLVSMRESHHPAPEELRKQLVRELENFKKEAHKILDDPKQVTQASYILCTALDEAAMNTPWGHQSNWSQYNLLTTFHNEVVGGERFFTLLKGLGKDPAKNIQLLELMYVCLALGFEGNYRIAANGRETLQKVRTWLYDIIQQERTTPTSTLSAHWQGSAVRESRLPKMTPLWVGLAGAFAVASITYISLLFNLSNRAENVVSVFSNAQAAPLSVRTIAPPARPVIEVQGKKTLSDHLAGEIAAGQLAVIESFDHGVIRLVGDSLFESGSPRINDSAQTLVQRTGQILNDYNGAVVITGFSDNVPIRSARFPSNLALSKARAESVTDILRQTVSLQERLTPEGRGSLDPIGDNATRAGRQSNRRVEITVYY